MERQHRYTYYRGQTRTFPPIGAVSAEVTLVDAIGRAERVNDIHWLLRFNREIAPPTED